MDKMREYEAPAGPHRTDLVVVIPVLSAGIRAPAVPGAGP